MMDRIDLFHLPFYKKEAFTGSDPGESGFGSAK